MGKIYDVIRELEKECEYESAYDLDTYENYIEIPRFMELLALYSNDSEHIISNYLMNSDDFLALPFYSNSYDNGVFKISKFQTNKNDDNDDDVLSTTENIVSDIADGGRVSDYNDYYWSKSEILELESIKIIGLDNENFERYKIVTYYDPELYLKLFEENIELKKRVNLSQKNINDIEVLNLKEELAKANDLLEKQSIQISNLQNANANLIAPNDKKLPPRTANNASKIISALASELLEMDLTKPYADETNGTIKSAIEKQGNSLGKDKIADWLKLAHDQSK